MLKFIYIKIGVGKMKKHILAEFCAVMLLFVANSSFAGALPDNVELSTKLNLFGSYASASENFFPKYKEASVKFNIDLAYHITEDLSFNFLPYVQGSYDINRQNRNETKTKIWQAYLNYKLSGFNFNIGRFDFADENLAPFIYYGEDLPRDLALPTSLDGLKHSFTSKYLDYTLLAAQEAQINRYDKAKIAGAKVVAKPLTWLNISGFYFYQNKKYPRNTYRVNSKLSVYGAGIDLFFSEDSGIRLYGAKNGGEEQKIRSFFTPPKPYKGYAFNSELYFQNLYETGTLKNKFGVYLFSNKDEFETASNKIQAGIIYSGINYIDTLHVGQRIVYAVFDFNFDKYQFLYSGLGIFAYSAKKSNDNRNYNAQEINLNVELKFDTWGFKLSGGLLEGEAVFLGGSSTEKQKIKKLQANFFYKFTL